MPKTKEKGSKQRKKRSESTIDYFNENQFREEILPIVNIPGKILPNSFAISIFNIIDGMINTEFRANSFVIENREELKQDCFFEVLKSLTKFKCEKGRSFAYFNRIIKNTLLKKYYKHNRICKAEVKIFDISNCYSDEDEFTVDEAIALIADKNVSNEKPNNNSDLFSNSFDHDFSKDNISAKKKQDPYQIELSVFNYLTEIINILKKITEDQNKLDYIVREIQYNESEDTLISLQKEYTIYNIIEESKNLFKDCRNRIQKKIEENPDLYSGIETPCVLINNRMLIYVKNIISDRKIRKPYTNINANPNLAAKLLRLVIEIAKERIL